MDDDVDCYERLARAIYAKACLDTVYLAIGEPGRITGGSYTASRYPVGEFSHFGSWNNGLLRRELEAFWHSDYAERLSELLDKRPPADMWRRIQRLGRDPESRERIRRVLDGGRMDVWDEKLDDWGEPVIGGTEKNRKHQRLLHYKKGKKCKCGKPIVDSARSCRQCRGA